MFTIFSYLACAAFIMLIIGLIKPKWGSFGRYPDINRWKLALLWFAVVAVFSSVGSAFMTDADKLHLEQRKLERQAAEQDKKDAESITALMSGLDIDKVSAKSDLLLLRQLGFTTVTKIFGNPKSGYELSAPELGQAIAAVYTDESKNITEVIYKNHTLYKDGVVKKTLKDIILTKADAERAYKSARKWVKNNLKDPDSAKFDDDKFGAFKENGIIKMSGIVRAKNSFNAIVPAKWYAEVDASSYNVLNASIDNE